MQDFLKELEELKKQSQEAQSQKQMLNLAGMIGEASASPSFGEVYLGRSVAKPQIGKMVGAISEGIQDPLEEKRKLLANYKALKDTKDDQEASDPNSEKSKKDRDLAASLFPKLAGKFEGISSENVQEYFKNPILKEYAERQTALAKLSAQIPKGMMRQLDSNGVEQIVPANPNKLAYDQLPKEKQVQIEELGKSSGNIETIRNQLNSALVTLQSKELPEDQKLIAARSLIKVLNSTVGKDAVGAEEAKRLAGLLEFRYLNLTEPGPVFGRAPISEFANQVDLKSQELGDALNRNKKTIASLYGNSGQNDLIDQKRKLLNEKKTPNDMNAYAAGKSMPTKISQGGHEYTWNPKTQKYE